MYIIVRKVCIYISLIFDFQIASYQTKIYQLEFTIKTASKLIVGRWVKTLYDFYE